MRFESHSFLNCFCWKGCSAFLASDLWIVSNTIPASDPSFDTSPDNALNFAMNGMAWKGGVACWGRFAGVWSEARAGCSGVRTDCAPTLDSDSRCVSSIKFCGQVVSQVARTGVFLAQPSRPTPLRTKQVQHTYHAFVHRHLQLIHAVALACGRDKKRCRHARIPDGGGWPPNISLRSSVQPPLCWERTKVATHPGRGGSGPR